MSTVVYLREHWRRLPEPLAKGLVRLGWSVVGLYVGFCGWVLFCVWRTFLGGE